MYSAKGESISSDSKLKMEVDLDFEEYGPHFW
jgi:hypothetical protein